MIPSLRTVTTLALVSYLWVLNGTATPARAFEPGPESLAVSPDGERLYVANSVINTVSVIDTSTLALVGTVKLKGSDPVSVQRGQGDLLLGMAISPDGSRLYVNRSYHGWMDVIDTSTNQVIASVHAGAEPEGVALIPDGKQVYVADFRGSVHVIDAGTNQTTATVNAGALPMGVAASPEGRRVYVADSSGRGAISVIDTATSAVVAVVEMGDGLTVPWLEGARSVAVSPDGQRVYATSPARYSVVVIDTTTNQVVDTIKITTGKYFFPTDLAVSPDGKRVYVTDFNGHSVSAIDTATDQVTATLPMSDFPWGVAVSPDSARLYVIHKPTWTVDVVDAGTLRVVDTVKLGPIPTGTN